MTSLLVTVNYNLFENGNKRKILLAKYTLLPGAHKTLLILSFNYYIPDSVPYFHSTLSHSQELGKGKYVRQS